jgi:DNA-binding beta-propeller fold protein YncE
VSTKTKGALNISLMKPFHLPDWHPVDIAPDPVAGVLVLEIGGGVSRIRSDQSGHHQESLFSVPLSYMVVSIAADIGAIYVTSNSQLGCTVFKFTIATRSVSRKIISTTNSCHGIATGGGSIYVVLTESKQIAYSDNWNSPFSRTFDLRPSSSPEPLVFDNAGQRLLVGDTTGKIYAVSVPSGKITLVNSEVGWAASIAATMNHILVASKTKIISIARADNRIENPPPLRSLTGGIIAGVVSDASGNIWYADYDNGSVVGPLVVK